MLETETNLFKIDFILKNMIIDFTSWENDWKFLNWAKFLFQVEILTNKLSDDLPPGGLQRENLFGVYVYCRNLKIRIFVTITKNLFQLRILKAKKK